MIDHSRLLSAIHCLSFIFLFLPTSGRAASFIFGGQANGLSGSASKTFTGDGIAMTLAVGANLPGAVFDESDARGVSINSSAVAGVNDIEGGTKINLLGGPVATESLTFSFDTNGVIDDIFFDGITDDALEFFRLESNGSYLATFFDFEIPNIVDVNLVTEPNIEYIYTGGGLNDDRLGINIPFQAGEVFTLSYGQLDALLPPGAALGNGGRFGGVNVHAVPEPRSLAIVFAITAIVGSRLGKRGQRR
jgi:hypothetical protein